MYQDEDWKNFGITAGRNFLGQRQDAGEGKCWYPGVDPAYFGAKPDYIDPNFPMGTAGVGFVLRKLYEASGELSAEKIDEVMLILSNLREGWEGLSGKLG